MDKEKIGKLIQTRRKEKGLSQKELAELIQVSTATVSKWETYVNLPDIAILDKIAEVLGIPLTNFFDSVDSAGETKPAFNSREPCTEETSASTIISAENDLPDLPQEAPPDAVSSGTKSRWPKQLAFAAGILLLIGIAITCYLTLGKKEDIFSPEICEEYAGDYEGQNAYYIVVESFQPPTVDELIEYGEFIRKEYEAQFVNSDIIVIIHTINYADLRENGFNKISDTISILFPDFG